MLGLFVALSLCAQPEPISVAMPAFEIAGVPDNEVAYWRAVLANHFRVQGVRVFDADPDAVLAGAFTRVAAAGLRVDLNVSKTGIEKPIAAVSMTAQNPKEVSDVLRRAAQELSAELFTALARPPVAQKQEPLPEAPAAPVEQRRLPSGVGLGVALGVVGAGGAIAGGVLLAMARGQLSAVARGQPGSYFDAQQQAAAARNQALVSTVALAAGGAVFVAGVMYALYSAKVNTFFTISASLAPDGGGLGVSGVWP